MTKREFIERAFLAALADTRSLPAGDHLVGKDQADAFRKAWASMVLSCAEEAWDAISTERP